MKILMILAVLVTLVALGIIFYINKNKKTIEGKSEEIEKSIEDKVKKLLEARGYKVYNKKKSSYNLIYNKRIAEVRLEEVIKVKKAGKKYLLVINNEDEKFTQNKTLRKRVLEFSYSTMVKGICIVNTKDKSIDTVSFYNKKEKELARWVQSLLIIVTVLLTLNVFFLLAFLFKA